MDFWDFLKSYVISQLVSELIFTIFIGNNHVPFHLLWKKQLLRSMKFYILNGMSAS